MSTSPRRTTVVVISAAVAAASVVFSFVMFLQPWRSCPGVDDSSAGCPALDRDVALLTAGGLVFVVGLGVLLVALLVRPLSSAGGTDR